MYAGVHAKSLQSYPMDCSPPGSFVHGTLQARILEWVAMPSSRDLSDPGIKSMTPVAPALQADSLLLTHWGSPDTYICMAESLHCSSAIIITLLISYTSIQNKKFKRKKAVMVPPSVLPTALSVLPVRLRGADPGTEGRLCWPAAAWRAWE